MKIIMENISVMYPSETSGEGRTLTIEDDGEYLHLNFLNESDKESGTITLTKSQVMMLRDNFNTILKNKLLQ
jgi:hypothetical protein